MRCRNESFEDCRLVVCFIQSCRGTAECCLRVVRDVWPILHSAFLLPIFNALQRATYPARQPKKETSRSIAASKILRLFCSPHSRMPGPVWNGWVLERSAEVRGKSGVLGSILSGSAGPASALSWDSRGRCLAMLDSKGGIQIFELQRYDCQRTTTISSLRAKNEQSCLAHVAVRKVCTCQDIRVLAQLLRS